MQFYDLIKDEKALNKFINSFDTKLYGEILLANLINQGKTELAKNCLDINKDIDINSGVNSTSLYLAALEGNADLVKLLFERGAINTPLTFYREDAWNGAAVGGNTEVLQLFLNHGIDVNKVTHFGFGGSALHNAAYYGKAEAVKFLIDHGANVNHAIYNTILHADGGKTALHHAIEQGHKEVIRILLDNGANVNQESNHGSPLHLAVKNRDSETVKLLLEKGADVNKANTFGTPLHLAVINRDREIVKLLLERGADVNKANNFGHTPAFSTNSIDYFRPDAGLFYASPKFVEMIKILLESGADLNKKGISGSALDVMNPEQHKKTIQIANDFQKEIITKLEQNNFATLPENEQIRLVKLTKATIVILAKQGLGLRIKEIISAYPEEKRMEYFATSARTAIIEQAKQGKDKKIDIILSAFPSQVDRNAILRNATLTPLTPLAKPLLLKQNIKNLYKMVVETISPPSNTLSIKADYTHTKARK